MRSRLILFYNIFHSSLECGYTQIRRNDAICESNETKLGEDWKYRKINKKCVGLISIIRSRWIKLFLMEICAYPHSLIQSAAKRNEQRRRDKERNRKIKKRFDIDRAVLRCACWGLHSRERRARCLLCSFSKRNLNIWFVRSSSLGIFHWVLNVRYVQWLDKITESKSMRRNTELV